MKKFWLSKTFWVMTLAFVAGAAQEISGHEVIPTGLQLTLLALIGLALRFVTKEPVEF